MKLFVNPVIVPLARSAPVGKPPLVLRTESVRLPAGPVQGLPALEQKSGTSTLTSNPVTAGMKVWPVQFGEPNPVPVEVPAVFCWSSVGVFDRVTLLGLVVRSQAVAMPAWKAACVVSTKHALAAAAPSEKSCTVVLPSTTTMLLTVSVTNPGALTVSTG